MTTPSKKTTKRTNPGTSQEATALLRSDQKLVNELFAEFAKTRSSTKKMKLVAQICTELSVHAQIEEEIFYPAVKKALKDKLLVPEATVEYATLKSLIAQVEGVAPDGEMYDARIKVLSEYVKHHVKEEQEQIFPKSEGEQARYGGTGRSTRCTQGGAACAATPAQSQGWRISLEHGANVNAKMFRQTNSALRAVARPVRRWTCI